MNGGSDLAEDPITVQSGEYPDLDVLGKEYINALGRIEHQHEILKEFSKEGMKMFRVLILFVAVPATILGAFSIETLMNLSDVLINSEPAVSFPSDRYFTKSSIFNSTGVAAVLAIAFHVPASGHELKRIRNQTNPNDIGLVVDYDITEESYYRMKLKFLIERIEQNRKVLRVMENLLSIGKFFTLFTVLGVGVLFYNVGTGGPVSGFALIGAILLIG